MEWIDISGTEYPPVKVESGHYWIMMTNAGKQYFRVHLLTVEADRSTWVDDTFWYQFTTGRGKTNLMIWPERVTLSDDAEKAAALLG